MSEVGTHTLKVWDSSSNLITTSTNIYILNAISAAMTVKHRKAYYNYFLHSFEFCGRQFGENFESHPYEYKY